MFTLSKNQNELLQVVKISLITVLNIIIVIYVNGGCGGGDSRSRSSSSSISNNNNILIGTKVIGDPSFIVM